MKGFYKMKSVTRGLALLLALLLAVPNMPIRVQAETASTQESQGLPAVGEVIKEVTFSDETGYTSTANDNTIEIKEDADGNKYLYFAKTTKTSCNVQFHLTEEEIAKIEAQKGFVLDCDLTLEQILADDSDAASYVDFFSSKSKGGDSWILNNRDNGKSAVIGNAGTNIGVVLYGGGRFPNFPVDSQKHHISLVYDLENNTVKLFIDGNEVKSVNGNGTDRSSTIPEDYVPSVFKLGAWGSGGDVSFAVDNFRIYLARETVKLEADTVLPADYDKEVTYDLNGHTLTGNTFTGIKATVVDSSNGKGLLKVPKDELAFDSNNDGYMPVWDSESNGYRFAKVTIEDRDIDNTEDALVFAMRPSFGSDDIEKLVAAGYETGMVRVGVRITWTDPTTGTTKTQDLALEDSWLSTMYSNPSSPKGVKFTISGGETITNFTATTIVWSNLSTCPNVEIAGTTHTYQAE